jgi:Spy/CpxP family protein refolding chaperone
MKTTNSPRWLCGALIAACLFIAPSLRAQKADPLGDNFFPPELLKAAQHVLDLTEEQIATLKSEVQKAEDRLAALKQDLEDARDKLLALVKKERLDEATVLAQSDKILDVERDLRRTQLALLIRIKNALTPEQQTRLKEARAGLSGLKAKMDKVTAAARQWEKEGRDLAPLREMKEELDGLMKAMKFKEAEALIERALRLLAGKEAKEAK